MMDPKMMEDGAKEDVGSVEEMMSMLESSLEKLEEKGVSPKTLSKLESAIGAVKSELEGSEDEEAQGISSVEAGSNPNARPLE